jgi:predicted phage replisome organizer
MSETKKYYWLKLKRDFFKRHDTKIIESMENGEKYLLFYLKLLVESLDHSGNLRFSDTVPYNEKMLSAITGTDIDIVRSAVKVFNELGMLEKLDDGTLFMSQVLTMTGNETEWAGKKRLYREGQNEDKKRTLSDKSIEYRDKSIEYRDKSIEYRVKNKEEELKKETRHKHGQYKHVLLTDNEYEKLKNEWGECELLRMINVLDEGIEAKGYKYKNYYITIKNWKKNDDEKKGIKKTSAVIKCSCGGEINNMGFCKTCGKELPI